LILIQVFSEFHWTAKKLFEKVIEMRDFRKAQRVGDLWQIPQTIRFLHHVKSTNLPFYAFGFILFSSK
jgi:hypothetical protein